MKQDVIDSIRKMIPTGNRLDLPSDGHFVNYAAVKKALVTAGGKYKKNGFDFTSNAEEIQNRLTGGEVINDKKKYQFFATPDELVQRLIKQACVDESHRVLEPSAGQGAIADRLKETGCHTVLMELMPENSRILKEKGYTVIEGDFLSYNEVDLGKFDRIVANPPFTNNQDVDHVYHMYSLLKDGGKMIAMTSRSWEIGSQKKQIAFQEWIEAVGGKVHTIAEGAFKDSGTGIMTNIVEINKPVRRRNRTVRK